MAQYRITCTRKSPLTAQGHHHIVRVGTGTLSGYSRLWTVAEVYQAMRRGDRFYTQGAKSGKVANVVAYTCCGIQTLRSTPDSVTDNNLDYLPTCQ